MDFNTYWYLGLGSISLLFLIYLFFKTKNVKTLLLFLAIVGLGYSIEAVIYNFLHSYHYDPNIIKHDRYYDSNAGAFTSNLLSLPVASSYIAIYQLKWIGIACITILFVGIEWLFLELNIYFHNWWKIGYTALGLPVYFAIGKVFYRQLIHPFKKYLNKIILFFITGAISGTLHFLPIMLFSNRYYDIGWFASKSEDTTAFAAMYFLTASLLFVVLVQFHWKHPWSKYVISVCIISIGYLFLIGNGILHSLVWWDLPYYLLLPILVLRITETVNKQLTL
ncbi:hypothetical protein [Brevibacillus sp. SYSU BS000544]|uniref:hypothetical protein n=1 Tax=Brevibacillus sp. SYSU BS000544 TaxID=3416443 RepID=UPI003CE453D4